jgi:hypothetical protein
MLVKLFSQFNSHNIIGCLEFNVRLILRSYSKFTIHIPCKWHIMSDLDLCVRAALPLLVSIRIPL